MGRFLWAAVVTGLFCIFVGAIHYLRAYNAELGRLEELAQEELEFRRSAVAMRQLEEHRRASKGGSPTTSVGPDLATRMLIRDVRSERDRERRGRAVLRSTTTQGTELWAPAPDGRVVSGAAGAPTTQQHLPAGGAPAYDPPYDPSYGRYGTGPALGRSRGDSYFPARSRSHDSPAGLGTREQLVQAEVEAIRRRLVDGAPGAHSGLVGGGTAAPTTQSSSSTAVGGPPEQEAAMLAEAARALLTPVGNTPRSALGDPSNPGVGGVLPPARESPCSVDHDPSSRASAAEGVFPDPLGQSQRSWADIDWDMVLTLPHQTDPNVLNMNISLVEPPRPEREKHRRAEQDLATAGAGRASTSTTGSAAGSGSSCASADIGNGSGIGSGSAVASGCGSEDEEPVVDTNPLPTAGAGRVGES